MSLWVWCLVFLFASASAGGYLSPAARRALLARPRPRPRQRSVRTSRSSLSRQQRTAARSRRNRAVIPGSFQGGKRRKNVSASRRPAPACGTGGTRRQLFGVQVCEIPQQHVRSTRSAPAGGWIPSDYSYKCFDANNKWTGTFGCAPDGSRPVPLGRGKDRARAGSPDYEARKREVQARWNQRRNKRAIANGFDEEKGVPKMTRAEWDAIGERRRQEEEAAEAARPKSTRELVGKFAFEQAKKYAWNAIKIPVISQIPLVGGKLNEHLKQKAVDHMKESWNGYQQAIKEQYDQERERAILEYERNVQRRREGRPEY